MFRDSLTELAVLGLIGWLVDPGCGGEGSWRGWLVDEPFGVAGVGGVEDVGADGADRLGSSIVDVDRMEPGHAGVVMLGDQAKNRWQNARASTMEPNVSGKSGRYLRVRKCDSL